METQQNFKNYKGSKGILTFAFEINFLASFSNLASFQTKISKISYIYDPYIRSSVIFT